MDWQLETTVSDKQVELLQRERLSHIWTHIHKSRIGYTPRLCGRDDQEFAGREASRTDGCTAF